MQNRPQSAFLPIEESILASSSSSAFTPYGLPNNTAENALSSLNGSELIIIDSQVDGYAALIESFGSNAEVYVLSQKRSGIDQITDILTDYQGLDAVHIISHGTSGALNLGNEVVDKDSLLNYSETIAAWGTSLADAADLLLYGCDVASGTRGQRFIEQLGHLTGADIAASTNLTGSASLGGNWSLEHAFGSVETHAYSSLSYSNVLFGGLSIKDNILIFEEILSPGSLSSDDRLTFSTQNDQLVVDYKHLAAENTYSFNLSDIKGLDIKTGGGDDTVIFNTVNFGKQVDLNITTEGGDDTVIFAREGSLYSYGGNVEIDAEQINVDQGYVLSTKGVSTEPITGTSVRDSGNITFSGQAITIGETGAGALQAKLLTDATVGYNAGNIYLEATQDSSLLKALGLGAVKLDFLDATIDINKAQIQAGDVKLLASVDNSDTFLADASLGTRVLASPLSFLKDLSLVGGVAVAKTKASIQLDQQSNVLANDFEARALTTTEAVATPNSLGLGVGVGVIDASSEVLLEGQITTKADLIIATKNENTLNVLAESDPVAGGLTAALAITSLDSIAKTQIASTANLTVGANLTVQSETISHNFTSANSAAPQEDDGKVAVAIAISEEDNQTQALVDGTVTVTGDISIKADQSRQPTDVTIGNIPLNGVAAGAGVNSNSRTNLIADTESAATDAVLNGLVGLFKKKDPSKKTQGQGSSFGAAGAVAYADLINSTTARVGAGATIKSGGDLDINSKVDSRPDISSGSSVDKPKKTSNGQPPTENKFAGSAAVAVGSYTNNAEAYIGEDATVDAKKDITVKSETVNDFKKENAFGINLYTSLTTGPEKQHSADVTTPVRVQPQDIVGVPAQNDETGAVMEIFYQFQGSLSETLDLSQEDFSNESRWKNLGSDANFKVDAFGKTLLTYLDGDAGLDNNLGDSFVQSTASSDKLAVAGGVTVLELNQNSNAYIAENAKINQDTAFQEAASTQNVTVEANNTNDAINLIGNIGLPGINGDITSFAPPQLSAGGAGTEGGKGAVGGSVLVVDYNNETTATIKEGVNLNSDSLAVKADAEVLAASIGVSGGSAGTFGANGTAIATTINNTTTAQIEDGVTLDVGNQTVAGSDASLVVDAQDESTVINIAGGVLTSTNVGIGASVSLNNLNRDVNAVIGRLDADDTAPSANTNIKSDGKISVDANAEGDVFTLGLAAAVVNDKKTKAAGTPSSDPQANTQTQGAQSADQGKEGSYGIAISGDVSINTTEDNVRAYINDAGSIETPQEISIQAHNDTSLIALSGSAAIVTKSKGNSVGIAGSVSVNLFDGETEAYATGGGSIKTRKLDLQADRTGNIFSLSAAAAATVSKTSAALAGSVSINEIANNTKAYLSNSTLGAVNSGLVDLSIKAKDDSKIIALGGSVAYGGKAGIGAAIAVNTIQGETSAGTIDATILNAGTVDITAINDSDIIAVTGSGGASKTVGGAGTVSINRITNTTKAYIEGTHGGVKDGVVNALNTAGNVTIQAQDTSTIYSLAGAVGIGGKAGLGAAIAYNEIDSNPAAYIANSNLNVAGNLELKAESERIIRTLSVGVGGGAKAALAGSVSINFLSGTTQAYIQDSTTRATQLIQAKAITEDEISSLSGGFAIGGKAAIGAAVSVNNISSQTKAHLTNAKVTSSSNKVVVDAQLTSNINNISVGGAGAGKFALGGSVSVNEIDTVTEAKVADKTEVTANQTVDVSAKDTSTISGIAGAAAGAGKAAIGAAVATNNINNKASAIVDNATITSDSAQINLKSELTAKINNITLGGAGAGSFALGGAVSVNSINTTTEAVARNGAKLTAKQSVAVFAQDTSTISAIAGGAAGAGKAAIGAAVATNNINNKASAIVDGSTIISDAENVNVESVLSAEIDNFSAGGAGAGGFALGGAVSVNNIDTTTEASVRNNANITAQKDVIVSAINSSEIQSLAGQISGAGKAAIGASVAVNNMGGSTSASIENSTVDAKDAINITAIGTESVETAAAGISVAGALALTGSVTVNNITSELSAFADGATLTAGSLAISANNTAEIKSLAGQVSAALKGAGIGAAVAYNNIGNGVTAYAKDSTIATDNNVVIQADNAGTIETVAAGLSAAIYAGVGGSVAVSEMSQRTSAYVQGGSLLAQGSIGILANSENTISSNGGTFAAGAVGVGGTVLVNNLNNQTNAYIKDANVNAQGNQLLTVPTNAQRSATESIQGLAVLATSDDELDVLVGTGAVGGVAFAATVAVNTLTNKTQAYVQDSGININERNANTNQSAYIKALNNTDVDVKAGSVGGGLNAIGASIDVTTIKNLTAAYVDNDENRGRVSARKDFVIEANARKKVETIAVAGGIGGVAIQGAVSVLNVGSAISAKGREAAADTQDIVNNTLSSIDGTAQDSDGNASIQTQSNATDAWSDSAGEIKGTVAFLTGKASVNRDLKITADETTEVDALTGAVGIGFGVLGAGGSVAIANVTHDVSAYIGESSTITVGRQSDIDINAVGLVESEGKTVAGGAGLVGLGAAVTIFDSKNNTSAYIGSDTTITQSRNVSVKAGSSSEIEAEGIGAALGAAAVGVVVATAKESGTTQAYVGDDVEIADTNSLNVSAIVNEKVRAESTAAAGGLSLAGSGSIATGTVSPTVKAYIGDRADIDVDGDVTVLTNVEVDADGSAKGLTIGSVAVGASDSTVNANPNIQTFIGAGATIEADNVTVESRLGEPLKVEDNSFNPASVVNSASNTLSFTENHGFRTGDTVFYLNGGGSDIGGLENQKAYSVIKVDDNTIKLGKQFSAAEIDVNSNTIKFDGGHGFQNGDEVIYEAPGDDVIGGLTSGQKYYVVVLDGQTIKLSSQTVSAAYEPETQGASGQDFETTGGSTKIKIDHSFKNGDVLNYAQRSAKFTVVADLPDTGGEDTIFNLARDVVDDDVVNSAEHGFETGDRVIYRATGEEIGGLVKDQVYYVIKQNNNEFKLSLTKAGAGAGSAINLTSAPEGSFHEIEAAALQIQDSRQFSYTVDNATNQITLAGHGLENGQRVTYSATGAVLGGLAQQSEYYVIEADNNSFKLSLTKGGSAIDLAAGTGTHQLSFTAELEADTPYYVVGAEPSVFGPSGSFQIARTKGGPALTLVADTGSGKSHLFSREQLGIQDLTTAGQGTHNLHLDLDSSSASGSKHLLDKGTGVTVPSQGDNTFSSYAKAGLGALLGGSATLANLDVSSNVKTYVGNGSNITATGDVHIKSLSGLKSTVSTDSTTIGGLAVGASKITADINNNNETYVGTSASIKATGDVVVDGQVSQTLNASANGGAGALLTFADVDTHISVDYTNSTYVGDNAEITAGEALTVKSASSTDARAKAEADGVGIYADADSNASVKVNGKNKTNIESGATLDGREVTVEAVVDTLKAEANTDSEGAGLIGNIDATSKVDLSGTENNVQLKANSKIKGDYVDVRSDFKGVNSRAVAWADTDGLGGDTDANADNIMPLKSKVSADTTATITANTLNVAADFSDVQRSTSAEHDRAWELRIWTPFGTITITMDFGSTDRNEDYTPEAFIDFNANVNLLSRDVNPVLVIDENGKVLQESKAGMVEVGDFVLVKDIINNQVGSVNFSAKNSTQGRFVDRGKYDVLDPAFDKVEITNHSDKDLVINDIKTLNAGATAPISYSAVGTTDKTLASTQSGTNPGSLLVNPTDVTINNLGNSNIVLKGVIDTASNRVVLYSTGSILSEGSSQNIVARELSVEAKNGSIGSAQLSVSAQLDQGHRRALTDTEISEKNKLEASANGSVYLNLGAQRVSGADPVTVNIETMDALTGEVNVSARQTTDVNGQAIAARYLFLDDRMQVGTNAVFSSKDTLNSVEAKSDFEGTGYLDVITGGYVDWNVVDGDLNVKQAVSEKDSVRLSVDASREANILAGAKIAAASEVTIETSGNVNFDQSATIEAPNKISIRGDIDASSRSAVVNWDGKATAREILIAGGSNDTTFNIRRSEANTQTQVFTGNGDDVVNVNGTDNTLSAIKGDLALTGANDNSQDTLNINASGSTSALSGKLSADVVTGLGTAGRIAYEKFESLVVTLGSGDDELALLNTSAETTIHGNGGDDHFRVGAELDATGQPLSESIDGQQVQADDISGVEHTTKITGGEGSDRFTINRNVAALNVEGDAGNDTLAVNTPVKNSQLVSNGDVDFVGGADQDEVTVNTNQATDIARPDVSTIDVQNSRLITVDNTTETVPNLTNTGSTPTDPTTPETSSTDSLQLLNSFLGGFFSEPTDNGDPTDNGSTDNGDPADNGSTDNGDPTDNGSTGNGDSNNNEDTTSSEELLNNFLSSFFSFF